MLLGCLENPIARILIEMLLLCSGLTVSMVMKYADNIVKVSKGNAFMWIYYSSKFVLSG